MLWQNSKTEKLSGGTYAQKISYDGTSYFLINGFHPRQIEYYTLPERCIVTMTLLTDTKWSVIRQDLIGVTNPIEARAGSIRSELYNNKDLWGLNDI